MSAEILDFPVTIRMEDFFAEEALKRSARMALAAACGILQGKPTMLELTEALVHIEEAVVLMQSLRAVMR